MELTVVELKKKEAAFNQLNLKTEYYHTALKNQVGQIETQKQEIA